jgi:site-specific DNA recombinase
MRVLVYARASTQRQKEKQLSVPAQLRAIRGYVQQHQWEIVDEFSDAGYSGRNDKRPGLRGLRAAIRSGRAEAIIVWKLDRLARDTILSTEIRKELDVAGMRIFSLHEPTGDSPQEKLTARMFEGLAEFYSDNLSQDIKRGQREVARNGFYPFSQAPIGYRRVEAKDGKAKRFLLAPEDTYGSVIASCFIEYSKGATVPEQVADLNERGIPAGRAQKWTQKRLYYILRNRVYCGDVEIGLRDGDPSKLETIQDTHEPLVSREVFERVQAIMDSRSGNHALARWEMSSYLLTGLLRCGICGRHMVGTSAKSGKYRYYTCQLYHQEGKDSCEGVRVTQRDLDAFVMARTRDMILDEGNLKLLVDLVNEQLINLRADDREMLQTKGAQLGSLKKRLQKNYEALESGLLELEDLAPRIRELRDEIRKTERTLDLLRSKLADREASAVSLETVLPYAQKLRDTLQIGSFKERKAFLAGLIRCIRVSRNELVVEYGLPLPNDRTEVRGTSVLLSVASGGGGGSRTRVRKPIWSASTSLVPHFSLGTHTLAD